MCGKRLKALLPILLPALERNGHLKLDEQIRSKILAMSAATVDRLLRAPPVRRGERNRPSGLSRSHAAGSRCAPLLIGMIQPPAAWKWTWWRTVEAVNRGSYVHSLVLTDIASGWTEGGIVVREGSLVVETLERVRAGLPFALRALDVDNGSEFVNDRLIEYCLSHGVEAHPIPPLPKERPSLDRAEEWGHCAEAPGV